MKNNKGVTLIALVILIVLIIIFSSLAIYTGINSMKLIELQKYKTQMQAIQSALDQFYGEYQNCYENNEDIFQRVNANEKEYMQLFIAYKEAKSSETENIKTFYDYFENKILGENGEINEVSTTIKSFNDSTLVDNSWWKDIGRS